MKTVIATTLLAAALLNAGAFASDNRSYLRGKPKYIPDANVTVLTKNQAWPVKTQMRIEATAPATSDKV